MLTIYGLLIRELLLSISQKRLLSVVVLKGIFLRSKLVAQPFS